MPRRALLFCSVVVLLFWLLTAPVFAQNPDDFTVVVLPDTQYYAQDYPQIFDAQAQWVVDNAARQNIQLVIGEGDIVNVGTDPNQWTNADNAIKLLDNAGIPYVLAIGNHDYDTLPPVDPDRSASNYNQWFGTARYASKSYYGTSTYPSGSNENFYATFTWGGKSYLILSLEFIPRQGAVDWAKAILDANPDKEVIAVTHSYLYSDGTTVDQCDTDDMRGDYNGSMLWTTLLSQYPNVSVVVSGHIVNQFYARRDDVGVNGNFVHEFFANWQDWTNGGNGYMRIMQFSPSNNTITVQTYSPYTSGYLTDPGNDFTVPWHNDGTPGSGTASVAGIVRNFAFGASCEPIAGATVTVGGMTATSDATGHYSLSVPPGQVSATATATGWQDGSQTVTLNDYFPNEVDFFLNSSAPCPQSTVDPSVTICTPTDGSTVTSPVNVVAGSNSSSAVQSMSIWLDGNKAYGVSSPQLNTNVSMTDGTHRMVVQGINAAGQAFSQVAYVTAGSSNPPPPGTCAPLTTVPSMNVCMPANNSTVTSPFEVQAAGNMASPISWMQAWIDGKKYYQVAGASLDTQVTAEAGKHRLVAQAVDSTGATVKQTVYVTVAATSPPPPGCTPGTTSPSVTICSPAANSTVSSPVNVVAATTDNTSVVDRIAIWVDGVKVWEQAVSQLDTTVAIATGAHRITVQAHDTAGNYFKSSVNVTVQ